MTGFASVTGEVKGYRLNLEARSLNHRFLEFKARLPSMLVGMEYELEQMARRYFERGKIELTVAIESEPEKIELRWSRPMARAYQKIFREMKKSLKISGKIDLQLITNQKDVIVFEPGRWGKESRAELEKVFKKCFESLSKARKQEGSRLEADLKNRLKRIEELRGLISSQKESVSLDAKAKLKKRVEQLLGQGVTLDPGRMEQELAILASRSDITEELDRIASHLKQSAGEMELAEAKGKKLDFLTQELNREFNTIGSKGPSVEISGWVIEAKTELERIRQQIQNIE
jgi:uncharacterized protein (TIGR00255 family)